MHKCKNGHNIENKKINEFENPNDKYIIALGNNIKDIFVFKNIKLIPFFKEIMLKGLGIY